MLLHAWNDYQIVNAVSISGVEVTLEILFIVGLRDLTSKSTETRLKKALNKDVLSLPCLNTFWHAIPTSFNIFNIGKAPSLHLFHTAVRQCMEVFLKCTTSSLQPLLAVHGCSLVLRPLPSFSHVAWERGYKFNNYC